MIKKLSITFVSLFALHAAAVATDQMRDEQGEKTQSLPKKDFKTLLENPSVSLLKLIKSQADEGDPDASLKWGEHLLKNKIGNPSQSIPYFINAARGKNAQGRLILEKVVLCNFDESMIPFGMNYLEWAFADNFYNNALEYLELDDHENSKSYFRQAANHGHPQAQFMVEKMHKEDEELKKNKKTIQQAADNGDVEAQYKWARILERKKDKDARKYYQLAAGKNHSGARNRIGKYLCKEGKTSGYLQFKMAAKCGHADAQYNMAEILVSQNKPEEARPFYELAANQGHKRAQRQLRQLDGTSFSQNTNAAHRQAINYFQKLAEQEDQWAQAILDKMN